MISKPQNDKHARALRRLISRTEAAMGRLATVPLGLATASLIEPIECEMEAALAEAREEIK